MRETGKSGKREVQRGRDLDLVAKEPGIREAFERNVTYIGAVKKNCSYDLEFQWTRHAAQ